MEGMFKGFSLPNAHHKAGYSFGLDVACKQRTFSVFELKAVVEIHSKKSAEKFLKGFCQGYNDGLKQKGIPLTPVPEKAKSYINPLAHGRELAASGRPLGQKELSHILDKFQSRAAAQYLVQFTTGYNEGVREKAPTKNTKTYQYICKNHKIKYGLGILVYNP